MKRKKQENKIERNKWKKIYSRTLYARDETRDEYGFW